MCQQAFQSGPSGRRFADIQFLFRQIHHRPGKRSFLKTKELWECGMSAVDHFPFPGMVLAQMYSLTIPALIRGLV